MAGSICQPVLAGNVEEFYETGLEYGVHYVGVDNVEDLPGAVEELRKDPERARWIAAGLAAIARHVIGCHSTQAI